MRQGRTAEMGWVVQLERRTDGKLLYLQAGLCRKREKQLCVVLVLEKTE